MAKNTELITTADNKAVSADKLTKDGEADSKNNDKSASSASTLSTATSMITVLVVMIAAVYSF